MIQRPRIGGLTSFDFQLEIAALWLAPFFTVMGSGFNVAIFLQRILNLIGNVRNRAVPLYMKGNLLYFFNAWFLYLDLIRCYIEIGDDLRFR